MACGTYKKLLNSWACEVVDVHGATSDLGGWEQMDKCVLVLKVDSLGGALVYQDY